METLTTLKVIHITATVVLLLSGSAWPYWPGANAASARQPPCNVRGCLSGC